MPDPSPSGAVVSLVEVGGMRPGWRFTEPEGPWPDNPRPGSFLSLRCWLDGDGLHVWQAHDCTDGRSVGMLPYPTWQAVEGNRVAPSIDCAGCGLHTHGTIDCEEVEALQPCGRYHKTDWWMTGCGCPGDPVRNEHSRTPETLDSQAP